MDLPETPVKRARKIIEEYSIKNPADLDLTEIAFAENLIVKETDSENFMGMLNHRNNGGIISISSKTTEEGAKRFTLAHEIGHFFNERSLIRKKNFHNCNTLDINSFKVSKLKENQANEFAAELLMHKPWFSRYIMNQEINIELLRDVAGHFRVSLTAAAIRYANIGKHPTAVIMSRDGKVIWSCINDYFPFKWIPRGYKVHKDSAACDYFVGREVQTCHDLIPAYVWFNEDFTCRKEVYLYEQNIVMKNYGSVLTILWESEFK